MLLSKFIGMSVLLTGALLSVYLWNLEQSQFDFQAQADMRDLLLWQQVITSVVLLSFILKGLNIKLIKSGWHIFPFIFVCGPVLVLLKYDQIKALSGVTDDDFEEICGSFYMGVFVIFILFQAVKPLLLAVFNETEADQLDLVKVKTVPRPINIPPIISWLVLLVGWALIYRNYALVDAVEVLSDEEHLRKLMQVFITMFITLLVVVLILRPLIKELKNIKVTAPEHHHLARENRKKVLQRLRKLFSKHFIHLCFLIISFVALKFLGGDEVYNWPVNIGVLYSFVAATYYFSFGITHLDAPTGH